MKRWMHVTLALSLATGLGCEKKKAASLDAAPGAATPEAPAAEGKPAGATTEATLPDVKPKYGDTTAMWALAPTDATFGFVIADGAGARVVEVLAAGRKKLEGKPFARKAVAEIDAMRKEMPFDIFDPASFKAKGIDLSKGAAAFGNADRDKPALIVLPVGDVVEFRKLAGATTEKVGDRDVDKIKETVCTTVGARYACAATLEIIDASMKPHDSALATAIKALPAEARGDAEAFVDIKRTPQLAEEMEELKQAGDFTTAGAALRLDMTSANLHLWANGTMSPIAAMLTATPPPPELAGMTANATTVLRIKVDPRLALAQAPPSMPVGDADVRTDLLDQLTGDIQLVTAGKGLVAGALMMKVTDAARVKKLLAAICAEAKKPGQLPVAGIVAKEDSCVGEVSLAVLKEAIGIELPPFKFNFSVTGNLFVLAFGELDPATLKGSVVADAGSPEAKEALAGAQTATFWTRGLSFDVTALPKALADKALAEPDVADGIAMLNFAGSQAYDLSFAAGVTSTGLRATLHVTSMDADPPEARTAYAAALDKKLAGDSAGYLAAMTDIEKKFPGTLAGRRAALERVGTPILGPVGAAIAGGAASAFYFLKMAGEGFTKSTAPGFGEPQPDPAPGDPTAPAEPPAAPDEAKPEPTAPTEPTEVKPEPTAPTAPVEPAEPKAPDTAPAPATPPTPTP